MSVIADFIEDCIEFDPEIRMTVADFNAAFASWWRERCEDDGLPWSVSEIYAPLDRVVADAIESQLKALAHPQIAIDWMFKNTFGIRYYCGIQLSVTGRWHWENRISTIQGPAARRVSHCVGAVRSHMPAGPRWWDHPLNVKIRENAKIEKASTD